MSTLKDDLAQITLLAKDTQTLWAHPTSPAPPFEHAAQQWLTKMSATLDGLGKSEEVKKLIDLFGLEPAEVALLLYVVLPYLDSDFHRFFQQFAKDNAPEPPSVDLLSTLLSSSKEGKLKLNERLHQSSPLFYWELLIAKGNGPFLQRSLEPSKSLLNHFAHNQIIDTDPAQLVALVNQPLLDLPFDQVAKPPTARLISIVEGFSARRSSLAFKLAQAANRPLFQLDNTRLLQSKTPVQDLKHLLLFMAFSNGVLYWPDGSASIKKQTGFQRLLKHWFELSHTQLVLGETENTSLPKSLDAIADETLSLKPLSPDQQTAFWKACASAVFGSAPSIEYGLLSDRYYPDYDRAHDSLKRAHQGKSANELTFEEVCDGYLNTAAKQIYPAAHLDEQKVSFSDMTLTAAVKNKIDLARDGFLKRKGVNAPPPGFIVLLEGARGNGKSMAALCMGNDLHLPTYQVDHAALTQEVSNNNGGLRAFFVAAEKQSACLIIDDIDTLLENRPSLSKTEKSVTATLKAELAKYKGLVVATTSQKQKLDPGFIKMAKHVITFSTLHPNHQHALFGQLLHKHGAQLDKKINLARLVKVLGANGRQIKDIIEHAIRSIKSGHGSGSNLLIEAKHLIAAIENEKKKT